MPNIPRERPKNLEDLLQYVRQSTVTCYCVRCLRGNHLNQEPKCSRADEHSQIPLQHSHNLRSSALTVLGHHSIHEAMHLAQSAIVSFSRSPKSMSTMQQKALKMFRRTDLSRFGESDAQSVTTKTLKRLYRIYNQLFFFGAIDATVSWKNLNLNQNSSTHVTFGRYERGHGWTFQRLASQLEKTAKSVLNCSLDLHGFGGMKYHWEHVLCLPSLHEMEVWGWVDSAGNSTRRLTD